MLLMFILVSPNECSTVREHGATRGPMKVYQSCCRILCHCKAMSDISNKERDEGSQIRI